MVMLSDFSCCLTFGVVGFVFFSIRDICCLIGVLFVCFLL